MENTSRIDLLDKKIQDLLDTFLKVRSAEIGSLTTFEHLNEDTLSAFVEGNINKREAQPVVAHLIDCSFCRNITTELVRLDLAFAGESIEGETAIETQPTKISEVLSGILGKIFGSGEGVVFAHHEKENNETIQPEKQDQREER